MDKKTDLEKALFSSIYYGNFKLFEIIFKLYPNLDLSKMRYIEPGDLCGNTPLYMAVFRGRTEMVRVLVEKCPEHLDIPDETGYEYPITVTENLDIIKILVEAGANVNTVYKNGKNIVQQFISMIFPEQYYRGGFIQYLIEKGADLFHKDDRGKNSFDYIRKDEHLQIVLSVLNKNKKPAKRQ